MNLLDLMIKIGVDDQASNGIAGIADKAKGAAGTLSNLGAGLSTAFSAGAAAVGAASTAISGLATAAVKSYANYEQLAGGVETLFKNSAGTVKDYAANAFQTSGLSANDYMETVTSFSASLLQSLGGDTAAAAEVAHKAIVDMSDNANKMGTSIEMIQNAYQGFAKGNYTMLDNLKLGYGGTAREMARLVNESGVLSDAQKINLDDTKNLGAALQEVGFDKMIEAIHAVQAEMGITGTTAKEAATTISGSLSSAASAWSNMLTGIADDSADFGGLISNFVGSVTTAAENILPRVEIALGGVANLVAELAPVIMDAVPGLLESVLPGLAEGVSAIATAFFDQFNAETWNMLGSAATEMILALGEGLTAGIGEVTNLITEAANTIFVYFLESSDQFAAIGVELLAAIGTGIATATGSLVEVGAAIVLGIVNNLSANLPTLAAAGTQIVESLVNSFSSAVSMLAEAAGILVEMLVSGITNNLPSLVSSGLEILESLLTGVINALPEITNAAVEIVVALVGSLTQMLPMIVETGVRLLVALVNNLPAIISGIVSAIPKIINSVVGTIMTLLPVIVDAGVMLFSALVDNADEIIAAIVEILPEIIDSIITALVELAPAIVSAGFDLFVSLVQNLPEIIQTIVGVIPDLIHSIVGAIGERAEDLVEAGKNLLSGLAQGMLDSVSALIENAKKAAGAVVDAVKDLFGIHSPSRVFAGIGENLMEGLWVGVDSKVDSVMSRIGHAIQIPTSEISLNSSVAGRTSAALANTIITAQGDSGGGSVNVNLVVDGQTLARILYDPLKRTAIQRGTALAHSM